MEKLMELKTIGKIESNILPFIKGSVKRGPYERLIKFLDEYKIKEEDIQCAYLHENLDIKYFQIEIQGYEEALYFQVKKEDFAVE